jgi:glycine C-acetyltransferase
LSSKHKLDFIDLELETIKQNNLYRKLRYGEANGSHISINGKKLLNLCSNDYLGIPTTKIQTNQLQSSSRLVSGNDDSYKKLEKSLACKLSDAKISIYKHNDVEDLNKKIKQKAKNKFIVTEGIFSMDGDISHLKQITEISKKYNAITIVDDAHGDFTIGEDGKGTPNYCKVSKEIDVYISSLSKGLGSFGGYVTSQNNVIDLCINKSKSFIYTSALPSFLIKHATKRFESNRDKQKKKLEKNIIQLSKGLEQIGYTINSQTHIIPIIIGNEKKAMDMGEFLLNQGIFAQPIRYPTVPKNQARLRISVTAWLTESDIKKALVIFEKAYKKFF